MKNPRASLLAIAGCLAFGPAATLAQELELRGSFDGSEYVVFSVVGLPNSQKSWSFAQNFAATNSICTDPSLTAHLATLTDPDEDAFVDALRREAGLVEIWAGGSQMPSAMPDPMIPLAEQDWFWENDEGAIPGSNDSSFAGYRNWLATEPNDNTGAGSEEHLAIGLGNNFGWNDEGNLNNIQGFVVECDATDNNGIQLLTENDGDGTIVSVGTASTGEPATVSSATCIVCRPADVSSNLLWYPDSDGTVDLRPVIAETEGCEVLDTEIPADERLLLLRGQRGFVRSDGQECFTASLVRLRRPGTDIPVDAVDGPVLSEEISQVEFQPIDCVQASVGDSPFSLGKAIGGGQNILTPETLLCNRRRTATRYSDRFQLYDARLDPGLLSIRAQLLVYGLAFNRQVQDFLGEGCVDRQFLRQIRRRFNRAVLLALSFRSSRINRAVDRLQNLAVFSLNVGDVFDPYREADSIGNRDESRPLCPGEAKGDLSSRILSTSYLVWRGLLFPDEYRNYALDLEDQTALRCLLPPFPTAPLDTIPAACADPDTLPPPFMP